MSLEDKASIVLPKGFAGKAGTLECWNPNTDSLVGLSVVRATTATRVNESGLIESVAANVPRRDFANGGCGDLLVEPQRTNIVKGVSTYFTSNLVKSDPSTNDNQGVAQTQFAVTSNGVNQAFGDILIACTAETEYYWWAVFESAGTNDVSFALVDDSSPISIIRYKTDDNSTTAQSGNFSNVQLEDLGNGSYKLSGKLTTAAGQTTIAPRVRVLTLGGGSSVTANGQIMKVSQIQIEKGSYVTSYIPTTTAAVTRNADVISGTGLAALLGQSEGGIYAEAAALTSNLGGSINLNTGVLGNEVRIFFDDISTNIKMQNILSGSANVNSNIGTYSPNAFAKVALRYANDNFAGCVNGGAITADTSATIATGLSDIDFSRPGGSGRFYGRIRELVIFNEAPDDTQLAAITTP